MKVSVMLYASVTLPSEESPGKDRRSARDNKDVAGKEISFPIPGYEP
jgi:hypothetical protein